MRIFFLLAIRINSWGFLEMPLDARAPAFMDTWNVIESVNTIYLL
jgi:hypothetical protein